MFKDYILFIVCGLDSLVEFKRLGQPGMPGGQDLEEALRSLSARQESHSSDRPFFDVERERKLRLLVGGNSAAESSGFLTPNDSLASTGTNYSGTSHPSSASSGSRSYLPERLQIVKPLEGKHTHIRMYFMLFYKLMWHLYCEASIVNSILE